MSKVGPEGRSFEKIQPDDLRRFLDIAKRDMLDFFRRRPDWGELYSERIICVALCQGAALHYINGTTGINDVDLYTFFRAHPARRWYAKRKANYDLGYPKFGQSVDKPDWVGRRVDCMARAIEVQEGADDIVAIQGWLREGRTESARLLARKAVVLLEPDCGNVIWP